MKLLRECLAVDLKDDADAIERYKYWHSPGGPPADELQELPFARGNSASGKWRPLEHIYSLAEQRP